MPDDDDATETADSTDVAVALVNLAAALHGATRGAATVLRAAAPQGRALAREADSALRRASAWLRAHEDEVREAGQLAVLVLREAHTSGRASTMPRASDGNRAGR